MDIAALETYVRDLDVSNCSKPELRRLLAAASSIAARGRAEIEARPCTFPARLAPLVTQWLPLSDVGAALSCSGQWRDTSEWRSSWSRRGSASHMNEGFRGEKT